MRIDIKGKVNTNAITAVTLLSNKYKGTPMYIGGVGEDKFPTVGVVIGGAECSERVRMEDFYTEELEQCYEECGEDLYESEPTYEGLTLVDGNDYDVRSKQDDKHQFGFYVLDGEFYDSIDDVIRINR